MQHIIPRNMHWLKQKQFRKDWNKLMVDGSTMEYLKKARNGKDNTCQICVSRELNKDEGTVYAEGAQYEPFPIPLWLKGKESWVSWRLKMSLEGCHLTLERSCCSQRPCLLIC